MILYSGGESHLAPIKLEGVSALYVMNRVDISTYRTPNLLFLFACSLFLVLTVSLLKFIVIFEQYRTGTGVASQVLLLSCYK